MGPNQGIAVGPLLVDVPTWWRWYADEPGPRRALALFAGQYAYERQGRAPGYPHAAYFAIEQSPALDAAEIWQTFQAALDGAGENPRLNPLMHAPTPCSCARYTFTDDDGLCDMVEAVRSDLAQGQVRNAFDRVDRVRGVGPKIASFFLRDLAVWFQIKPAHDRELLQPVDVWVRRYVAIQNGANSLLTDHQNARWICDNSEMPEAANQGLWYFASVIAGSEVRLRRALANEQYAGTLVESHLERLREAVAAWTTNPP